MNNELIQIIEEQKIIVIIRRLYGESLLKLVRALYDGGIRLVEVTFDQADKDCLQKTAEAISSIVAEMGDEMQVGAGTVLTIQQVEASAKAGAKYIISPNTDSQIIKKTKELGLVSMPGAMTPSEMVMANQLGADFVKVFPMGHLGLKYMKDVMAPISHVKFIATGGVTEDNFSDYLGIGIKGAGISGRLTDTKLISENNFKELTNRAKKFVSIANGKMED